MIWEPGVLFYEHLRKEGKPVLLQWKWGGRMESSVLPLATWEPLPCWVGLWLPRVHSAEETNVVRVAAP